MSYSRSFFYSLDRIMETSKDEGNTEVYKICEELKEFIKSATFTRIKDSRLILGYWGEPDSYVEDVTGKSANSIRQLRLRLSKQLYELLGYDFFGLLEEGSQKSLRECIFRMRLASKDLEAKRYLYRELIDTVKANSEVDDEIDITTCKNEIQFLVKHSRSALASEMSTLDMNKLNYLIRMLDNETGSLGNIYNLTKCFDRR